MAVAGFNTDMGKKEMELVKQPESEGKRTMTNLKMKDNFRLINFIVEQYASSGMNDEEFAVKAAEELSLPEINVGHIRHRRGMEFRYSVEYESQNAEDANVRFWQRCRFWRKRSKSLIFRNAWRKSEVGLTPPFRAKARVLRLAEINSVFDIENLRQIFESRARDSHGFQRSVKGTYTNPAVARDWKWFMAGAAAISQRTLLDSASLESET